MSRAVQKLRIYLLKRGESQAKFAVRTGITPTYMSMLMTGVKHPGPKAMAKVEASTGGHVSPVDWFSPKKSMRRKKGRSAE